MSYIHIPHKQLLEHRALFQILQTHAIEQPNKEAIVFRDEKLNRVSLRFQECDSKSRLLAAGLLEIGMERGDRVLVLLPSYLEFVLFHLALNRIGAIMLVHEENRYSAVFGTSQLACVIARVAPTVVNNDKVISEIKNALHQNVLKAAILVGSDADADLLDHPKAYTYQKMYTMANSNPQSKANVQNAEAKVQMDDPCLVLFTSGTTSLPKPIEITHHCYVNGILATADTLEITRKAIHFNDFPFAWIAGIVEGIGTCIVIGLTYIAFPPQCAISGQHTMTMMKIIEEESVTHVYVLLNVLHEIVSHKKEIIAMNLKNLKFISTGGQHTPLPLVKTMFDIWPDVQLLNIYGTTEVVSIAVQKITRESLDSHDYGIMRVVPGLEIKIVNEEGDICLRSAWVSFCNWDYTNPDLLKGRVDGKKISRGWHSSKDAGVVVNQNCIRLYGRLKFMIKVAGESIPPVFVESKLQEHPDVKKVCVVGVPDERLYHKICACVILEHGHHDNIHDLTDQLDQWSNDKFWGSSSGLNIKPHYYIFLDSFPVTRTGKVSRREVRSIAIKDLGLI
ncbi:acyl-CoA synthetase family member 2, mitochondrial isoform X2 [Exaiptasia diaphana]|uniref:Uncharacterized protein n=1 Tax=Exaiptasia diaphana TaxID=2652724 RepID=A0A913YI05_EXADI|nr:acyl-CoA synthetase family member 2, mitochondrial isoform X2 [Exaiptasia diaphana]